MPAGLFTKRRVVWMSCIFATILGVAILWPAPTPVSEPLPSPNGYDDFIRAGQLLASVSSDYTKMPPEELRVYVSTNQEPLRMLRLGLTRDCRKPIEYTRNYYQHHAGELGDIKRLAQLVAAEGRLAEAEGRLSDAARSHFENLSYGRISATGGLIIEKLVGIAIESMGIVGIERIAEKLSAADAWAVLRKMIEGDKVPDNPNEFLARDHLFFKQTSTPTERLRLMWEYKTLHPERFVDDTLTKKVHQTAHRRRQLMLRLAAHIYQLEKGTPPRQMSDLVPNILPTIPVDPETGTNLVLNPSK